MYGLIRYFQYLTLSLSTTSYLFQEVLLPKIFENISILLVLLFLV